jgi:hypothetical protein
VAPGSTVLGIPTSLQGAVHLQVLVDVIDQPQPAHLLLHLEQLWVHGDRKVEELLRVRQLLPVLLVLR